MSTQGAVLFGFPLLAVYSVEFDQFRITDHISLIKGCLGELCHQSVEQISQS